MGVIYKSANPSTKPLFYEMHWERYKDLFYDKPDHLGLKLILLTTNKLSIPEGQFTDTLNNTEENKEPQLPWR